MLTWSFVVAVSRLPVAMAPLAFVFLGRETSGGYTIGAVMAAVYTAAEAAGAPLLGSRLRTRAFRREIAAGLVVSSAAFAALAFFPGIGAGASIGLAAVAGAGCAAAPGALRTMVSDLVGEKDLNSALSLESSLNMAVWAASPAVVAAAALHYSATLPFFAAAAFALMGAACVFLLPEKTGKPVESGHSRSATRHLVSVWPIYMTSVAVMYLLATVELSLPALLEQRDHAVAYSGPLLTCFALASILGGIVYGLRTWPGNPERQSTVLLLITIALISIMALSSAVPAMATYLLLAGFAQAIVLIARNLSLRSALRVDLHPVGYSILYAGSGIGYGVSAATTGVLLAYFRPSYVVLSAAAVTLLLTAVSVLGRGRAEQKTQGAERFDSPDAQSETGSG
ncbi:MFS transporter [Streptomyces sp. NPDC057137]|uniref:MFS transporter n=1 Tax=Streptomyces sp. NPDC057137 TaxID=3346030 RepID=UPI00362A081B